MYCTALYVLVLLSQSVSWLALQVGSGVIDNDAGQDTGSRCSLVGGTAEASEWTQSGLGRFWPFAGKGLFQWENPMATWPPRSNPAKGPQSGERETRRNIFSTFTWICFILFCLYRAQHTLTPTSHCKTNKHFSSVTMKDDTEKCISSLSYMLTGGVCCIHYQDSVTSDLLTGSLLCW